MKLNYSSSCALGLLSPFQEDASNITILGLLLDCSLPKHVYSHPQVLDIIVILNTLQKIIENHAHGHI